MEINYEEVFTKEKIYEIQHPFRLCVKVKFNNGSISKTKPSKYKFYIYATSYSQALLIKSRLYERFDALINRRINSFSELALSSKMTIDLPVTFTKEEFSVAGLKSVKTHIEYGDVEFIVNFRKSQFTTAIPFSIFPILVPHDIERTLENCYRCYEYICENIPDAAYDLNIQWSRWGYMSINGRVIKGLPAVVPLSDIPESVIGSKVKFLPDKVGAYIDTTESRNNPTNSKSTKSYNGCTWSDVDEPTI